MTDKTQNLQQEADLLESAIAEEIENIQEKIWHKLKLGLSVALIGIGTFWILKKWLDYPLRLQDFYPSADATSSTETTETSNAPQSQKDLDIIAIIKREIAVFLLAIAKQKIYELLEKIRNYENEPHNEDE